MKHVSLAGASLCALAVTFSGCYWLAQYQDLSSAFGDAGSALDAQSVDGGLAHSFCSNDAGPLVYCTDFDGVDAGSLGLQVYGADAAIVNGTYVSSPSSLFVALQGAASFGRYAVSFPSNLATSATLEFQVQPVNLNEGVTTLALALAQASTVQTLSVVMLPHDGFQVQEYFSFPDGGVEINPHAILYVDGGASSTGWHHVVLTLTVNGTSGSFSGLTVDNQVLEDGGQPLALPWVAGTASLNIGVTYAAAGGPQFYFDNVRGDFGM